jgi:uncharacterized membrane protein YiaA
LDAKGGFPPERGLPLSERSNRIRTVSQWLFAIVLLFSLGVFFALEGAPEAVGYFAGAIIFSVVGWIRWQKIKVRPLSNAMLMLIVLR